MGIQYSGFSLRFRSVTLHENKPAIRICTFPACQKQNGTACPLHPELSSCLQIRQHIMNNSSSQLHDITDEKSVL